MAQETQQPTSCPSPETWYAYVDGSLAVSQQSDLAEHLQECDRCFTQVASIRNAVETFDQTSSGDTTPEALLEQASGGSKTPTSRSVRSLVYAAAAVLVLGLGLTALYTTRFAPNPFPEPPLMQLALLDTEIQKHDRTWAEMLSERKRGLPGTSENPFHLSVSARNAVQLGSALVQFKAHFDYAHDLDMGRYQLNRLKDILNRQAANHPLHTHLETLASKWATDDAQPNLESLYDQASDFAHSQGLEFETYFYLGQWLQGAHITASTATFLSVPFATVSGYSQQSIAQILTSLQNTDPSQDLISALIDLNLSSKRPEEIRDQIDTLLRHLSAF